DIPLILGDHVSAEDGTGAVHTAPGHGQEDFVVGLKYGLVAKYTAAQLNPVDGRGVYLPSTPPLGETALAGLHIWKANTVIVDALRGTGALLAYFPLTHSYPHCWRHHKPVAFRATPQWFISMDQANLRADALDAIKQVEWFPDWGQARINGMIENRPDWTISRQRTWGVPIALFIHRETGEPHPNSPALMRQVAERVEREGADAWYALDAAELLGEQAKDYDKVVDILDVWFDSGVSHDCVLAQRPQDGLRKPADMYLEGSDQHRGWFHSALLTGIAMDGHAPYREVLTHGFVVDENGEKMSKSKGNVIEPQKVIDERGADVLRLWVASTDSRGEMSCFPKVFERNGDVYRRLRNTARFLLGNLHGFDPAQHLVANEDLLALDRWIVHRAYELQADIANAYRRYDFPEVVQALVNFCSVDLGSLYLDVTKDRLYTMREDSRGRRSAQSAMYRIAEAFARWIAPILSFTADELWGHLPANTDRGPREENVLFATWYEGLVAVAKGSNAPHRDDAQQFKSIRDVAADLYDRVVRAHAEDRLARPFPRFDRLLTLREEVAKTLEPMRASGEIGAALDAEIAIQCSAEDFAWLSPLADELRFFFISGDVTVEQVSGADTVVSATVSAKPKCVRCWHHRDDVGTHADHPELCGRCVSNVEGPGEDRKWF
ncbi:MAG: isoleucine--tRNA ligase, partial [Lysobacter sp.]|nr:isoleucine--tRNA ligase [Lysobacter sp.]